MRKKRPMATLVRQDITKDDGLNLPEGWDALVSLSTGRTMYYHESSRTFRASKPVADVRHTQDANVLSPLRRTYQEEATKRSNTGCTGRSEWIFLCR